MNYKSIAKCDVALRPLTVVVGRNGSGKSNFLDSLHFLTDALRTSLEYAIRRRGGIREITYRGKTRVSISVTFSIDDGRECVYSLELDRKVVDQETLEIRAQEGNITARYRRSRRGVEGEIKGQEIRSLPKVLPDRLALVALSGHEVFRDAFDTLSDMRFYRLNPEAMREMQEPTEGGVLSEDGSNISSVWDRLQRTQPAVPKRLTRYLSAMVPNITKIHRVQSGLKETLHFHQKHGKGRRDLMFEAASMSDGTLRALGALVASRQGNGSRDAATVVAIEEPETALHPGAVASLMDALHEASFFTQIIVTSHSPDVVDHVNIESDALLVTEAREGATIVAGVDSASREAIRRHLYTPGELLRMDQLQPATDANA